MACFPCKMLDFTELYKQTGNLCVFSPNGLYLATAVQYRLVIRDADSLQILHLFNTPDALSDIVWSPDSDLILTAHYRLGCVQVWSLRDEQWTAKIEEGLAGCTRVLFAPDARHILSFSDFDLRLTIWSLVTKKASYIQYPKFSDRGFAFRSDGRYFAITERLKAKDHVAIYDTQDWTMLKRWPVDTVDLENLLWSPDGRFLAVWESCLEYKMFIYYPDGRLVSSYSAYDTGLGIKSVAWTPSSQFLVIGSYDQKVRFLNYYTWKPLLEFSHPSSLASPDIKIYREIDTRDYKELASVSSWAQNASSSDKVRYHLKKVPVSLPLVKVDPEKPNPKLGVGLIKFNCDGRLVATRNDNMPNCLWIWDIIQLRQIALIQQLAPIQHVMWNPLVPESLVYSCGGSHVYSWNGESVGADAIEIPAVSFNVQQMTWNPDGKSVVLMDREKFTLAFPVEE